MRRATNIHRQGLTVTREAHAALKHQRPAILWFTGLSGAGKSTIANLVETTLLARGVHTALLDGDNVRHGLNKDLGFTAADRVENIRRIAEVARLMTDAGLIVLTSFISPFRAERRLAREIAAAGEFIEIYVEAPLETVIARDPKGLYKRALAGQIKNFTGVDQPYEAPEAAELVLAHRSIDARGARRPRHRRVDRARAYRAAVARRAAAIAPNLKTRFDGGHAGGALSRACRAALRQGSFHEDNRPRQPRVGRLAHGFDRRIGQDPRLLFGRQPGEFSAGDQHHRHQLRRLAARLQPPDRIQARHHRGGSRPRRKLGGRRRRQDHHLPLAQGREVPLRAATSSRPATSTPTTCLFSFDRQWKPDHPYAKVSGGKYDYFNDMDMPTLLDSIEKTDDYTVVFKLKTPNVAILANLAMDFASIGSAEYADFLIKKGTPEQFDQVPVGTGPFSFVAYQKDSVIRYKANKDYFGEKALVDDLVFAITPDATARYAKLQGGRVPHQRLSAPGRPRGDEEGPVAEGHQHVGPQHRLLGVQRLQAAPRQEGGAPGAEHGDRPRRDHQGRLSRRRREGEHADPAHHVGLSTTPFRRRPTTPRRPRRC